jgi:hypothetical protein
MGRTRSLMILFQKYYAGNLPINCVTKTVKIADMAARAPAVRNTFTAAQYSRRAAGHTP